MQLQKFAKKNKKQLLIAAASITLATVIISQGFGYSRVKVNHCVTTTTAQIIANYSAIETYRDAETGDLKTETVYWTERASPLVSVTMEDGQIVGLLNTKDLEYQWGVALPALPRADQYHRRDVDFDYFSTRRDNSLSVEYTDVDTKVKGHFTQPIKSTPKCLDKINLNISAKTWYGITYGSNF